MWIYYFVIAIIASNLYRFVSPSKPEGLIPLDEYFIQVRQKGRFWELFQVVSVPLLFIYNQFILFLFLLQGAFQILVWLFHNLIIDGLFLVARLLFHYLLWWPWNLFLLTFAQLRRSWSLGTYKLGAAGLSVTLATAFIGHFLVAQFGLPGYLEYVFSALSVVPFAYSLARISQHRHQLDGQSSHSNGKTVQYVLFFVGIMILLAGVGVGLMYAGTFTALSPVFTALFSAGSIFLSIMLIINAVLVFYLLSVIPQHLLHSDSDNKTMAREILYHLLHRWPQYIIGGALSIIPAALLSILPALLLSGSIYITKFGLEGVMDWRIKDQTAALSKSTASLPISFMVDPQVCSLDSARTLLATYAERKRDEFKAENLSATRAFISKGFSRLGHPYALVPLAGVAAEAYVFHSLEQSAMDIPPVKASAKSASEKKDFENSIQQDGKKFLDLDAELHDQLEEGKQNVDNLQYELDHVCVESKDESVVSKESEANSTVPEKPAENSSPDYCEQQRSRIRSQIEVQEKTNRMVQEKLNRLTALKEQLLLVHSELLDSKDSFRWIFAVAYLLFGVLIALLIGCMAAFFLVTWANTNYAIYHQKEPTSKWYITEEFEKANARSRHQPYLGLFAGVVLLALLVVGGISVAKIKDLLPKFSLEVSKSKSSESLDAAKPASIGKKPESTPMVSQSVSTDDAGMDDSTSIDNALMELEMERQAQMEEGNNDSEAANQPLAAGNYLIFLDSFASMEDATQALLKYRNDGYTGLRIIVPGSFLGENSEYFLITAGFDVNETEASRIKAVLESRGVSYVIQKM